MYYTNASLSWTLQSSLGNQHSVYTGCNSLTRAPSGPNICRKLPMNSLDFSSHFWMRSMLFSSTFCTNSLLFSSTSRTFFFTLSTRSCRWYFFSCREWGQQRPWITSYTYINTHCANKTLFVPVTKPKLSLLRWWSWRWAPWLCILSAGYVSRTHRSHGRCVWWCQRWRCPLSAGSEQTYLRNTGQRSE